MAIPFDHALDSRVAYRGSLCSQDELRESIWLVTIELRSGLPKDEARAARREIAEMEAALDALRAAEEAGR